MAGPLFYDAASLLLDNYVDVPTAVVTASLASLQAKLGPVHARDTSLRVPDWPRGLSPGNRQAFALTALQRSLKALGTFGYQVTEGGNPGYVRYARRTWRHARRLLRELGWEQYEQLLAAFDRLPA
jgi:aminoglycoside/choline kinase family phosphotransferase